MMLLWAFFFNVLLYSGVSSIEVNEDLKRQFNKAGLHVDFIGRVYEDSLQSCREVSLDLSLFTSGTVSSLL